MPKDTEKVSSQSVHGVSAAPDSPAAFLRGVKGRHEIFQEALTGRFHPTRSRHRQVPAGGWVWVWVCVSGFIWSHFQAEH